MKVSKKMQIWAENVWREQEKNPNIDFKASDFNSEGKLKKKFLRY